MLMHVRLLCREESPSRVDKEWSAGQNEKAALLVRLRLRWSAPPHTRARVAELADALRSGRSDRKVVEVRVLSRAPILRKIRILRQEHKVPLALLQEQE